MLKQETYEKVSELFGTIVGVASIVEFIEMDEATEVETPMEYKMVSDEMDVNNIINKAIEIGKYKELQKGLYILNKKRNPRAKELTIYKRAWSNIKK